MIKKERAIILGAIILIAVIIVAAFAIVKLLSPHDTIKVSGNIEGNDVRISFRVGGQIEELIADEGSVVKTGDVVARLNQAFVAALNAPETKTRFAILLAEPVPSTADEFGKLMASERAKYEKLVKASGARVD